MDWILEEKKMNLSFGALMSMLSPKRLEEHEKKRKEQIRQALGDDGPCVSCDFIKKHCRCDDINGN